MGGEVNNLTCLQNLGFSRPFAGRVEPNREPLAIFPFALVKNCTFLAKI